MRFKTILLLMATVASCADATPVRAPAIRRRWSTELSLSRRNVDPASTHQRRTDVPLKEYLLDSVYWAQVDVGTPPQPFFVNIDTGSPFLLLLNNTCSGPNGKVCSTVTSFNPSASSTLVPADPNTTPNNVSYSDGSSFRGPVLSDTVTLGGVTAHNMNFTLVDTLGDAPDNSFQGASGLIGLALGSDFFASISRSGQLPAEWNGFGMALARRPDRETPTQPEVVRGGTFWLGEPSQSDFAGEFYSVAVDVATAKTTGKWDIPLDSVTVQGVNIPTTGLITLVDSGSTRSSVPIKGPGTDGWKHVLQVPTGGNGRECGPEKGSQNFVRLPFSWHADV